MGQLVGHLMGQSTNDPLGHLIEGRSTIIEKWFLVIIKRKGEGEREREERGIYALIYFSLPWFCSMVPTLSPYVFFTKLAPWNIIVGTPPTLGH